MIVNKGIPYYNNLKKEFNKKYNNIWKDMSGRPFVGDCSYLFHKHNPKTLDDFFKFYLNDYDDKYNFNTHKGTETAGRSEEQLIDIAKYFLSIVAKKDPKITLDDCIDYVVNNTIVSTFMGHMAEIAVIKLIESCGKYKITNTSGDLDAILGVDIVVRNDETNRLISYIQVKPLSSVYNEDMKARTWVSDYYKKQEKLNSLLSSNGVPEDIQEIKYIVYDYQYLCDTGKVRVLCKGNRLRFNLSELCNNNGISLLTEDDLVFKEI